MKKNVIKVTIILSMLLLTLIPLSVNAATSGKCGDNLTWVLNNSGILSISGTGAMTDWEYYTEVPWYSYAKDIKEVYVGNNVTSIGDCAFADCINLLRIELPDNMDSIGESAFANCASLVSMTIPNDVTSIQNNTFYSCNSLQSITIPDTVTGIGSYAFCLCYELRDVTIPNGVTYIGAYAFESCTNLTNIIIPDTVKSISNYAFSHCSRLTSIAIPDSVTYIGYCAFSNCTGLTKVNITDLTAWCNIHFNGIDANPLFYAQKLYLNDVLITNLIIPEGVTIIKDYAFERCTNLTSITIPDSVTSIGEYVFWWCNNVTSVTIGNGLTSIEYFAFKDCNSLSTVFYNGNQTDWGRINIDSTYNGNDRLTWRATRKYFYYVTLIDNSNKEVSKKMQDIDTVIDVSDIIVPDNYKIVLYKDKEQTILYDINTPISENITLYMTFSKIEKRYTKTTISENRTSFVVNPFNIKKGETIIFACYNGDKMVYVNPYIYAGETTIPFTTTETYDKVKVFVWEDLENLVPLCEAEDVPLN